MVMTRQVALVSLVALTLVGASPAPSVEQILAKAIERARLNEDKGHEVRYHYRLRSITNELDRAGEIKETEQWVYESKPIGGIAYERLVRKDGRELTEKEQRKEDEREERFRRKVAEGKAKHNDVDERVAFDEKLVSRFDIRLEGEETLGGRRSYRFSYVPKNEKLPEERRFDRVLNRSGGRLWIDVESYEIARLTFELKEKVRLWWGVFGSISEMTGEFSRQPVDSEVWLPERFDFYVNGRVLFRSLHLRQNVSWSGFAKRDEEAAPSSPIAN